ncbi:MAG: ribosomal protein L7/L12 [Jaaginema sp. PMC 1079.18]|nr:ribosomal protein L7/L12 [Jaaginema sp. PMC 1080.18]MEC4850401.1 ribosomal protein L7/L12 [Jaaginema sp. PMC 1079.18]MEC4865130.1 ribosomal protein L7/L12 [Jaaginema sp. PMC 1078.18]
MSAKVLSIIEQMKTLTLWEATELIHQIEDTFGVSASPVHQKIKTNLIESPKFYDVILETVPKNKKIAVVKIVWNFAGEGINHARKLVESAPILIQKGVESQRAFAFRQQLERLGATVTLNP